LFGLEAEISSALINTVAALGGVSLGLIGGALIAGRRDKQRRREHASDLLLEALVEFDTAAVAYVYAHTLSRADVDLASGPHALAVSRVTMLAPQPIYDWLHNEWSVALKALSQAANKGAGKVSDDDHTK
jgi:hypothetical protein